MKAMLFDIQRNSFVDGPGIRTAVFFKGCNMRCKWCHNPESQSGEKQMLYYKDKCVGCGKCKEVCPNRAGKCDFCGTCVLYCPTDARKICGKEYTVDEVFAEIVKDKPYYENSGGGVTCSGGECMLQIDFLCELLKKCRENGIHTAVDTAGNLPWEYFERVMPYTDLFLYDVKCKTESLHIEGTDVSNRLILQNLTRLSEQFDGEICIRIPIIGTFNDDMTEMSKVRDFLHTVRYDKIELLPYHAMGENKYAALQKNPPHFTVPDTETMTALRRLFDI